MQRHDCCIPQTRRALLPPPSRSPVSQSLLPEGWEDAARSAVSEAAKTLHGIKSIDIKNFEARVKNGEIVEFRINAQISFVIECDETHCSSRT
jgi:flavin-binding protein dodecin